MIDQSTSWARVNSTSEDLPSGIVQPAWSNNSCFLDTWIPIFVAIAQINPDALTRISETLRSLNHLGGVEPLILRAWNAINDIVAFHNPSFIRILDNESGSTVDSLPSVAHELGRRRDELCQSLIDLELVLPDREGRGAFQDMHVSLGPHVSLCQPQD